MYITKFELSIILPVLSSFDILYQAKSMANFLKVYEVRITKELNFAFIRSNFTAPSIINIAIGHTSCKGFYTLRGYAISIDKPSFEKLEHEIDFTVKREISYFNEYLFITKEWGSPQEIKTLFQGFWWYIKETLQSSVFRKFRIT